jgi:hypothetical protein
VLIGILLGDGAQVGLGEGLGGGEKLMQHSAVLGIEPPLLGRGEPSFGYLQFSEVLHGGLGAVEALLNTRAQGRYRRIEATLGADHGLGRGKQASALALVLGRAVGRDKRQRLVTGQARALDSASQGLLGRIWQRAQDKRH